jgi:addiction module RelE/StbE family toxin
MDIFKVNITEPAENDLRDIARYISSQLNAPTTALNMMQTIRAAIAGLETEALCHQLVRDDRLAAVGYRSRVIKNYIAFYIAKKKKKTVRVDRILYGRRDWVNILVV